LRLKNFKLEIFYKGKKTTFYTVVFEGEQFAEVIKFFQDNKTTFGNDLVLIRELIENMADKKGAEEVFFRMEEGQRTDAVTAIPRESSKLRLYCLRFSKGTVILYNGGEKNVATYQEDPKLDKVVKELQEIGKLIEDRIKEKDITYDENDFVGNLEFELEEDE
jgi:hypothetical protein